VHGTSEVSHVTLSDTSHGDTAVHGEVDVELVGETLALRLGHAGEGEHTNLVGEVAPITSGTSLLELVNETLTHGLDAGGHGDDIGAPLSLEVRVAEDGGHDARTVDSRVAIHGASNDLHLREDTSLLVLVGADDGHGTNTLTVETEVLGEGLAEDHLEAHVSEETDSVRVLLERTRGEALVSRVEPGEETLALHDLCDLAPLLLGRIDTGGVVGASMEKDDSALGSSLEVGEHAVDVETAGGSVPVAVGGDGEVRGLGDGVVVAPGRLGDVDGGSTHELGDELGSDAETTGTGEGLDGADATLLDGERVGAEEDLTSELAHSLVAALGEVLLIELGLQDLLLSTEDALENLGLAIVSAIGTDGHVDLSGIRVSKEKSLDTKAG